MYILLNIFWCSQVYGRSAGGWTTSLFANATRGMATVQSLVFHPNPTLQGSTQGSPPYPSLLGRVFGDQHVVIFNYASDAFDLQVTKIID
jgi:hypothetical protein